MERRIIIVTGHFGSGKTEFAVNYCMKMKGEHKRTALIDLDIANPYFRSRERRDMLEKAGVSVYGNAYGRDIASDLPAVTAALRAPLEDTGTFAVIDSGGDSSGARALNQFRKYFGRDCAMLFVINANRPETRTFDGIAEHMNSVAEETGIKISGIVNNTHMLRETTCKDIIKGYELCREIAGKFKIPLLWNCCAARLSGELNETARVLGYELDIFPFEIYMREPWMDL